MKDSAKIIEFAGRLNSVLTDAMSLDVEDRETKLLFVSVTNKIWDAINLNKPGTLDNLISKTLEKEECQAEEIKIQCESAMYAYHGRM